MEIWAIVDTGLCIGIILVFLPLGIKGFIDMKVRVSILEALIKLCLRQQGVSDPDIEKGVIEEISNGGSLTKKIQGLKNGDKGKRDCK